MKVDNADYHFDESSFFYTEKFAFAIVKLS